MTELEQRISIAEACGWRWYRRPATGPWAAKPMRALYHPLLVPEYVATLQPADMTERECNPVFLWREGMIPDYLNDLNSIHEVEKSLSMHQSANYEVLLDEVVNREFHRDETCLIVPDWHATAAQRAEAFLKCLGKWKSTP